MQAVDAWIGAWVVFANAMKVDKEKDKVISYKEKEKDTEKEIEKVKEEEKEKEIEKEKEKEKEKDAYFTMEEIGKHKTPDDLWLIIDNKVYNLSKFFKYHPGGGIFSLI